MPRDSELTVLCAVTDVEAETPVRVEAGGNAFLPDHSAKGFVDRKAVECPVHQGRFHIPTGRPRAPPCTIALRVRDAHIIDRKICIDVAREGGGNASQGTK